MHVPNTTAICVMMFTCKYPYKLLPSWVVLDCIYPGTHLAQ